MIKEILIAALLLSGSLILLLSTLGVMRLPDIFCRSHSLAKSMPLAINLMLIGAWIYWGDLVSFKTFLAILFQSITIPISSHALALLAYKTKTPRWKEVPPVPK